MRVTTELIKSKWPSWRAVRLSSLVWIRDPTKGEPKPSSHNSEEADIFPISTQCDTTSLFSTVAVVFNIVPT